MKGRACQKVFLGSGFPRFKCIIEPLDVAKTGGLGQLDAGGPEMDCTGSAARRKDSI